MNMFEGQSPALKQNELYPSNYVYKYPKAGEKNSKVSVYVYDVSDRTTTKMDTGEEDDIYLPRIRWTQDPKKLAIICLNRHKIEVHIAAFLACNDKLCTVIQKDQIVQIAFVDIISTLFRIRILLRSPLFIMLKANRSECLKIIKR